MCRNTKITQKLLSGEPSKDAKELSEPPKDQGAIKTRGTGGGAADRLNPRRKHNSNNGRRRKYGEKEHKMHTKCK